MATMRVNFASCVHDSVEYGSDDVNIVSRVFFSLWSQGLRFSGLHADIKHSVEADLQTVQLDITLPSGFDGPISPEAFRRVTGQYYRALIDRSDLGTIAGIGKARMRDSTYLLPRSFEFPVG